MPLPLVWHRAFQYVFIIAITVSVGFGVYEWAKTRAAVKLQQSTNVDASNGLIGYWTFDGDDVSGTTAYDRSSGGHNGTLTNGPTLTRGQVGQAVSLDGSDDRVAITDAATFDVGAAGSWCHWFYSTATQSSKAGFSHGNSTGDYVTISGYLTTNSTVLSSYIRISSTAYSVSLAKSTGTWNSKWYHVCTTFDKTLSSKRLKLYVDGVLAATSDAANGNIDAGDEPLVGTWRNGGSLLTPFQGYIDDVRVYSRALSATEVQQLYVKAGSNTVNNSPQNDSLSYGLAGYWKLDDGSGTTATDSSIHAKNGTLTNGPTWTTGQIGGGVDLDGTNDYITMGDQSIHEGMSQMSLSIWINMDALPATNYMPISKSNTVGQYRLNIDSTGAVHFVVATTNNTWYSTGTRVDASETLSTGQWYHLMGVYDGRFVRIYINGRRSGTGSQAISGNIITDADELRIGYDTYGNYFNGKVDEARLYNRALSDEEAERLYQTTAPTALDTALKGYWSFDGESYATSTGTIDWSGAANNGTLTNTPTKSVGTVGQSLTLNGSNQYVSLGANAIGPDVSGASQITLAAWMKPSAHPSAASYARVLSYDVATGSTGGLLGLYDNGKIAVGGRSGSGDSFQQATATAPSLNEWHLVSGVLDIPNDTIYLYLDGVLLVTQSVTFGNATYTQGSPTGADTIGSTNGSSQFFTGSVDEIRVFNRGLTASEMYQLYREGAPAKINTSSTTPLSEGLLGYWKLDDGSGTSAADATGNANTGTLTGGPSWTTGQINGAVDFDGTDDYITVSDPASGVLDIADSANFTVTGWFNRDTFTTDDTILAKRNGIASTDTGYIVYVDDATDKLTFEVSDGTDEYQMESSSTFTSTGWNYFTIIWNDSSSSLSKMYINGIEQSTTNTGTFGNVNSLANAVALNFGAESDAGNPFDGKLDDIRLYNRPLSVEEVLRLYRTTAPSGVDTGLVGYWPFNGKGFSSSTVTIDRSGRGNNGTLTGGPVKTIGRIGQGISFDGTDDYIDMGDAVEPSNITVSAWVKPDVTTLNKRIVSKWGASGSRQYLLAVDNTSSNKFTFSVSSDGATANEICDTTSTYTAGQWYFLVGTYDGSDCKIYVNGTDVSSIASSTSGNIYSSGTYNLRIGAEADDGSNPFDGSIDEVRIYNRALSSSEIGSLYNQGR